MKKLAGFLFSFLLCTTLFAGQIKQIVILGDSLSDNGNLYNRIKIVPKSPPYFNGRFSNGPTWAEDLGKFYSEKSSVTTENYAVGGATSILHNLIHDPFIAPFTLTAEIYDYSLRSLFVDKSSVLYVIWIGANDYLYEQSSDMDSVATAVVENIGWAMNNLINQGAKNFLVLNLPDLSKTPYIKSMNLTDRMHAITLMHNKKLADLMKQMRDNNPEDNFVFVDVYSVFNELTSNPTEFNNKYGKHLQNLTDSCWQGSVSLKKENQISEINADFGKAFSNKTFNATRMSQAIANTPSLAVAYRTGKLASQGLTPCSNSDEYIFWDAIHPTEAVHEILASVVEQNLVGLDI